jgi:hypothetical protein
MQFVVQRGHADVEDARLQAEALMNLTEPAEALMGLTQTENEQIVNFAVPAP